MFGLIAFCQSGAWGKQTKLGSYIFSQVHKNANAGNSATIALGSGSVCVLADVYSDQDQAQCTIWRDASGWYLNATTTLSSAYKRRSEEHTSELQSLMRISYAVFCLKKKKNIKSHDKKK